MPEKNRALLPEVTTLGVSENMTELSIDAEIPGRPAGIWIGESPSDLVQASFSWVGKGSAFQLEGLEKGKRYYFKFEFAEAPPLLLAQRKVPLARTFNTRDLGGYRTSGGRTLRWGRLFRSDALSRLEADDQDYLCDMKIKLVIDLRSGPEAEKAPDILPADGPIRYVHLPIQTGEMNFVNALEKMKKGDVSWLTEDYMLTGYIKNLDEFSHVWREAFKLIVDQDNLPIVFHCTGGKDRAGTLAALILLALGVPEETVIADHQLSNALIKDLLEFIYQKIEAYGIEREKVVPYFTAPLSCIEGLIRHLKSQYGGVEKYLIEKAGLEPVDLRSLKEVMLVETP